MQELKSNDVRTLEESRGEVEQWGVTNLEQSLAVTVELHAEADATGLTGAGELAEQSGQDGAGQRLLQERANWGFLGLL